MLIFSQTPSQRFKTLYTNPNLITNEIEFYVSNKQEGWECEVSTGTFIDRSMLIVGLTTIKDGEKFKPLTDSNLIERVKNPFLECKTTDQIKVVDKWIKQLLKEKFQEFYNRNRNLFLNDQTLKNEAISYLNYKIYVDGKGLEKVDSALMIASNLPGTADRYNQFEECVKDAMDFYSKGNTMGFIRFIHGARKHYSYCLSVAKYAHPNEVDMRYSTTIINHAINQEIEG